MATVTFADGFTADQISGLLAQMATNGVVFTPSIGDGLDTLSFADAAGDGVVLTGNFEADDGNPEEFHGSLVEVQLLQASTVVATATDLGDLQAGHIVESLSEGFAPEGEDGHDGGHEFGDLLALLGAPSTGEDSTDEGSDGGDDLSGDDGDNSIDGAGGDDHVDGGGGDDDLSGGDGNDDLDGGDGSDTADYQDETGSGGVVASLANHTATDTTGGHDTLHNIENLSGSGNDDSLTGDGSDNTLDGNDGDDALNGASGDDDLNGGAGDDHLSGGNGNDSLDGGDDNDAVSGDKGNDVLAGGNGQDTMTGGKGHDTFLFTDPAGGADRLTDFRSGTDKIAIDFVANGKEGLGAGDFFTTADTSGETGHAALVYDQATGKLYYDADGTGGGTAVEIAELKPNAHLSASDLVFVG